MSSLIAPDLATRSRSNDLERQDPQLVPLLDRPLILVAHPALPAASLTELFALARRRPGEIFFASTGNGSSIHLAGEMPIERDQPGRRLGMAGRVGRVQQPLEQSEHDGPATQKAIVSRDGDYAARHDPIRINGRRVCKGYS